MLPDPGTGLIGAHRSVHAGGGLAWGHIMSVRFHIMAADKGYLPSFLAIGDAFFYGWGALPR